MASASTPFFFLQPTKDFVDFICAAWTVIFIIIIKELVIDAHLIRVRVGVVVPMRWAVASAAVVYVIVHMRLNATF